MSEIENKMGILALNNLDNFINDTLGTTVTNIKTGAFTKKDLLMCYINMYKTKRAELKSLGKQIKKLKKEIKLLS